LHPATEITREKNTIKTPGINMRWAELLNIISPHLIY